MNVTLSAAASVNPALPATDSLPILVLQGESIAKSSQVAYRILSNLMRKDTPEVMALVEIPNRPSFWREATLYFAYNRVLKRFALQVEGSANDITSKSLKYFLHGIQGEEVVVPTKEVAVTPGLKPSLKMLKFVRTTEKYIFSAFDSSLRETAVLLDKGVNYTMNLDSEADSSATIAFRMDY